MPHSQPITAQLLPLMPLQERWLARPRRWQCEGLPLTLVSLWHTADGPWTALASYMQAF